MKTSLSIAGAVLAALSANVCCIAAPDATPKPETVQGKLVYPNGKPATDAVVILDTVDYSTRAISTQTFKPDATGTVSITVDPAKFKTSLPVLFATSPTGIGFWNGGGPGLTSTCTLEPFTSVRIQVLNSQGKPVPHVHICPSAMMKDRTYGMWSEALPGDWNQVTDAAGYATIPKLPQGFKVFIDVADDRYACPGANSPIQLASAATSPTVTVKAIDAGSVSGRVIFGPTKKPVVGVEIVPSGAFSIGPNTPVVTDKDGSYIIHRLPAGSCTVSTSAHTYNLTDWLAAPVSVDVVENARSVAPDIMLVHGGMLTGKVTDKATGKPIPKLFVSVMSHLGGSQGSNSSGQTSQDGTFNIRVLPGMLDVYLTGFDVRVDAAPQTVSIADGETKTADFQIATPAPLTAVHGAVLGPDGKAVSGAQVITKDQYEQQRTLTTDAQGQFTIDLPGLQPKSTISARSGTLATASEYIYAGESNVTLHLVAGTLCTIKGDVKNASGKPLEDVSLELIQWKDYSGSTVDHIKSDANGHYAFPPNFGNTTYSVQAASPGYAIIASSSTAVTTGQIVVIPTLVLNAAHNFAGGTVVDAKGKPVANASISDNDVPGVTASTDAAGHFTIQGVPDGKTGATITFNNRSEYHQMVSGSGTNMVTINTPVTGTILGPDGKPVPGAEVTALTNDEGTQTVSSDATGHFTLDQPGIKPGARLVARSSGLGTRSEFTYNGEDHVTLNLSAGAMSVIKGQTKDQAGAPISGATVTLMRTTGNMEYQMETVLSDAQGSYAFSPSYSNSKYDINASAKGYGNAGASCTTVADGRTIEVPALTLGIADSFVGGTVVDSKGSPVANITVKDGDTNDLKTTTDKAGHFMLSGVPRGKTDIWIESTDGAYGSLEAASGRGDNVLYMQRPGEQK